MAKEEGIVLSTKASQILSRLNDEYESIADYESDYEDAQSEVQGCQDEIDVTQRELERARKTLEKEVRNLEKAREDIKKLAAELITLIDDMDPKKKAKVNKPKEIQVVPNDMDALESREA